MLKKIGTEARKELEKMLGTKIYLGLFVKVMPDWRENPARVKELDWHDDSWRRERAPAGAGGW